MGKQELTCYRISFSGAEMIKVELPYDIGTFMKVLNQVNETEYYGTVAAYTITDDGWLVWVSGYKQNITGEYLPDEVIPMTKDEITDLKLKYG